MTTLLKQILPIPDSTTVGSGGFAVPVNRYGHLNAGVGASSRLNFVSATSGGGAGAGAGSSSTAQQWLVAGDAITVSSGGGIDAFASVLLNAQIQCVARASANGGGFGMTMSNSGTGSLGWSVSLFRIPKNNLPTGLAEGE